MHRRGGKTSSPRPGPKVWPATPLEAGCTVRTDHQRVIPPATTAEVPATNLAAPRASAFIAVFCTACLLPLAALAALRLAAIPLGQADYLIYRYSPLWLARLIITVPALLGALLAMGLMFAARHRPGWLWPGVAAVCLALGMWTWIAPPRAILQHTLNMMSPSHDGAFVAESARVVDVGDYLRGFDERIQQSVAEMRGTRILSNTPGMTLLAVAVRRAIVPGTGERPGALHQMLLDSSMDRSSPELVRRQLLLIDYALVLLVMWITSGIVAYGLGRVLLSPLGAGAFAVLAMFNPATVHFSPGKDSAQLLTINLMLWAWLAGWRYKSAWRSAAAGALLVIGMSLGLVHLWVALAAAAATLFVSARSEKLPGVRWWLVKNLLPMLLGSVAVMVVAAIVWGWNMPATFLAVTRRYAQLQAELEAGRLDRGLWLMIGIPLFLLFVGPGLWTVGWIAARAGCLRAAAPVGLPLAIATTSAMLATVWLGTPAELPRLWIAFLPPLTLGLMASSRLFARPSAEPADAPRSLMASENSPTPPRRIAVLAGTLVAAQIATTALHFCFLDVRESEYRLISRRLLW